MNPTPAPKIIVDSNNPLTIDKLKNAGFRVTINHFRLVKHITYLQGFGNIPVEVHMPIPLFEVKRKFLYNLMQSKGGYTTLRIHSKPYGIDIVTESKCHPLDTFCKSIAVKRALGNITKELRSIGVIEAL